MSKKEGHNDERRTRYRTGVIYLVIWLCLLSFFLFPISVLWALLITYLSAIIWCVSWACFGTGAGFINSRSQTVGKGTRYYFFCSLFVAFIKIGQPKILSYAIAALTGIVVGFIGEKLPAKMESMKIN